MLDTQGIDDDIADIIDKLADGRLGIDKMRGARLEKCVKEVAEAHGIGVTNVMGRIQKVVMADGSRFGVNDWPGIVVWLRDRGVGSAQPKIKI